MFYAKYKEVKNLAWISIIEKEANSWPGPKSQPEFLQFLAVLKAVELLCGNFKSTDLQGPRQGLIFSLKGGTMKKSVPRGKKVIYCRFITKAGKRIYPRNAKFFRFVVNKD